MFVDELEEIESRRGVIPGMFIPNGPTHLDQLKDCEPAALRKTLGIRDGYLMTPVGVGEPLIDRVSLEAPVSETALEWLPAVEDHLEQLKTVHNAAETTAEMPSKGFEFPNLAWEAIKFGLAKENYINEQLNHHIDEIQKKQKNISLLLDLSGEISGMKEDEKELPPKAKEILEKLKQGGIEFKEGLTIEELKRQGSSKESDLRSQMQIAFTTEVQRLMQHVESIHQILQNIIRSDAKVKEKANQLQK
ncbi:MAG: hypothetical protein K1X28_00495 [Parachlamydiales bacterium]|nr:hypothetical protein [Parachlamydiales bacterium]